MYSIITQAWTSMLLISHVSSWSQTSYCNHRPKFRAINTKKDQRMIRHWRMHLSAVIDQRETTITDSTAILTPEPTDERHQKRKWRRNNLRIRSSRREDLDQISNILQQSNGSFQDVAGNNCDNKKIMQLNFKDKMFSLRQKSSFKTQLLHRLNAILLGKDAFKVYEDCLYNPAAIDDYLADVWHSHDRFRSSIELAARSATIEECAWDDHSNFSIAPEDSSFLHHTMISIEDINESDSNNVIGFCEIAILPIPSTNVVSVIDLNECRKLYAPFIVNLAIDSSYRRKGIAKHVMRFVRRHVQFNYAPCFTNLGLYVHENNLAAIRLYDSEGFFYSGIRKDELLFMQSEL